MFIYEVSSQTMFKLNSLVTINTFTFTHLCAIATMSIAKVAFQSRSNLNYVLAINTHTDVVI